MKKDEKTEKCTPEYDFHHGKTVLVDDQSHLTGHCTTKQITGDGERSRNSSFTLLEPFYYCSFSNNIQMKICFILKISYDYQIVVISKRAKSMTICKQISWLLKVYPWRKKALLQAKEQRKFCCHLQYYWNNKKIINNTCFSQVRQ